MIKIDVLIKDKNWKKYLSDPTRYLNKQAKKINLKNHFKYRLLNISIMLTGNNDIRTLNKKFRKHNKSTDVLSFPFYSLKNLKLIKNKKIYIGDIAISYEIINSRSKNGNFFVEFDKVWVHGLLHLLGYNHTKDKDYLKMYRFEKKILNFIK